MWRGTAGEGGRRQSLFVTAVTSGAWGAMEGVRRQVLFVITATNGASGGEGVRGEAITLCHCGGGIRAACAAAAAAAAAAVAAAALAVAVGAAGAAGCMVLLCFTSSCCPC